MSLHVELSPEARARYDHEGVKERLKHYRLKAGVCGATLSRILGYERHYITRVEQGVNKDIRVNDVLKAAKALKIHPRLLFEGEEGAVDHVIYSKLIGFREEGSTQDRGDD